MADPQPHIQCKPAQEVAMACNFSCDELEFVVIFFKNCLFQVPSTKQDSLFQIN
jgi:hypothetical protein